MKGHESFSYRISAKIRNIWLNNDPIIEKRIELRHYNFDSCIKTELSATANNSASSSLRDKIARILTKVKISKPSRMHDFHIYTILWTILLFSTSLR